MSLTKAAIFERVISLLGSEAKNVHDIDDELLDVLQGISADGKFLPTSSTSITTTASLAYVDVSTLLIRNITEVWVSGDNHLTRGNQDDYLASIEGTTSPSTGEPTKWFLWGNNLHVYDPIPNDEYTLRIEYYKHHAASTTTIEYPDRFRKMIVAGVLRELWDGVLDGPSVDKVYAANQYQKYYGQYMVELEKHKLLIPADINQVTYRDI